VRRHPEPQNGVMDLMIAELLAAPPSYGRIPKSLNLTVFRSCFARNGRVGASRFLSGLAKMLQLTPRWRRPVDSIVGGGSC
jgi:lysyl-tRNA synthetase, class II